ncbi:HNH endonuclease signature motif containing protein [Actinomycetospora straminea]|uniref:HNH endonuclease signature motif containing protein n=1 Tax=Actinomycetospora straminea TaxID=663607 RepID=A0ABP9DYG3_9PSEU|nr:HNH endonuclease signature motif containing protein [Actinomycetospora straminea]MDD7932356.1 DUF222 domain-containing protein [Actinomycetospora straminea]
MSEQVMGPEARAALERARLGEVARRRESYTRLEQVAELDRSAVAEVTGDRSTERLLEELWRISAAEARRAVAESRDLCPRRSLLGEALPPRLPCTATVAASGEIGPAHIAIIRATMRRLDGVEGLPAHAWADAEQALADEATRWGPRGLQAVADRLLAHLDPDGDEPPEEARSRDDELLVTRRRNGTLLFRGRMGDPVDGEAFLEVIDGLATRCGPEDQRELALRRVDGLKDLVADARSPRGIAGDTTGPDPDGRPEGDGEVPTALLPEPRRADPAEGASRVERPGRALLTITIDHRWLRQALGERGGYGLLDSGARVHPATARRWACDAEIIPVVLGSRSEPLDVGRTRRTATDAIRRALDLRDGGCAFPGCARRPRRCQAHHVDHWLDGGDTALDNMCLLCSFHHQLIHHGHWTTRMIDGRPWFTPPWVIDPDRRPRPGGRPRVPT